MRLALLALVGENGGGLECRGQGPGQSREHSWDIPATCSRRSMGGQRPYRGWPHQWIGRWCNKPSVFRGDKWWGELVFDDRSFSGSALETSHPVRTEGEICEPSKPKHTGVAIRKDQW